MKKIIILLALLLISGCARTVNLGSFNDIFAYHSSAKCTVQTNDDINASMIVYTGDKYRYEMDIHGVKTYSILDNNMLYTWTDATNRGMIINITSTPNAGVCPANLEKTYQEVDIHCESFKTTPEMFIPPANIDFVDMQEMLKSIGLDRLPS